MSVKTPGICSAIRYDASTRIRTLPQPEHSANPASVYMTPGVAHSWQGSVPIEHLTASGVHPFTILVKDRFAVRSDSRVLARRGNRLEARGLVTFENGELALQV